MTLEALTRPLGGLIMALFVGCLVFAAFRVAPPLVAMENRARDLAQAYFYPKQETRDDIALVLIDETTLAQLPYRSPIDRAFLAGLVARRTTRPIHETSASGRKRSRVAAKRSEPTFFQSKASPASSCSRS